MNMYPRREVEEAPGATTKLGDPQDLIPSFVSDLAGHDVLFHHAPLSCVGLIDNRIAIFLGTKSCSCGCGGWGKGLVFTGTVEQTRNMAATLAKIADEQEADAATSAAAALAKAAGR